MLFAKKHSWDLLLDLLEYYSLEICKGASFGMLEIYFETFGPFIKSPRRENYFKNVCNLYRLPGDYVRRLLAESTLGIPRRFSTNKLQIKVIKQVNTMCCMYFSVSRSTSHSLDSLLFCSSS